MDESNSDSIIQSKDFSPLTSPRTKAVTLKLLSKVRNSPISPIKRWRNKNNSSNNSSSSNDSNNIIKSGWLSKRGHFRKSWKKRFVVLTPGLICYFAHEEDAKKGLIGKRVDENAEFTEGDNNDNSNNNNDESVFSPGRQLKGQCALYGAVVDTLQGKPALKSLAGGREASCGIYIVGRAGEKDFIFQADTPEEANDWCSCIREEIHLSNDRRIRSSFGDITTLPRNPFPPPTIRGKNEVKKAIGVLKQHWSILNAGNNGGTVGTERTLNEEKVSNCEWSEAPSFCFVSLRFAR